ncbi:mandelate racemase/muconate lactonizing enzyme family protein [Roseomonas sp. KE2513]|uniref:mandelate racemase/muconate lactonizing enzyme family protein n=1 Tax=Roseomonas sp. KE2513 TaxID=2479202 RepID=UPI0018DFF18A|nr:mandelate racemase/muconate lactonizing enzyme family protein [Roseomonas sp. KE2513]MBI0538765.1 mandelate racemase/muconate lactonizing enzyme family protein [Roseomonas sp. KE2513]
MKITRVEAIAIQMPLPRDFPGSSYSVVKKEAIITRLHTDHGPVGHCINGEGQGALQPVMVRIIEEELAPMLIGEDPGRIEALWAKLWRATSRGGRDPRAAVRAVACVDSALWDLAGKAANMPLYRMWGGARDRLPIIAIGGQYHDDYGIADYGREMEDYLALGLAGCKFKVGGRSPEEDAARTGAARAAGGESFILAVDANRGWTRAEALDFIRRTPRLNIRWFEEPVLWANDRKDMALLRATTGLPICAGQSEMSAEDCRDLMLDAAIDVCNFDASWGGGPTPWLRVAAMAALLGVEMAHHGEPVIGSHLLAAVGNGTYAETHHPQRDPVFHRMLLGRGAIESGDYLLPQGPGWGVNFDQDLVRAHRVN